MKSELLLFCRILELIKLNKSLKSGWFIFFALSIGNTKGEFIDVLRVMLLFTKEIFPNSKVSTIDFDRRLPYAIDCNRKANPRQVENLFEIIF